MSSGCIDCFGTTKGGKQTDKSKIVKEATDYAKEKGKAVALYQEQDEWHYIDAIAAFQQHLPVSEVISPYQ